MPTINPNTGSLQKLRKAVKFITMHTRFYFMGLNRATQAAIIMIIVVAGAIIAAVAFTNLPILFSPVVNPPSFDMLLSPSNGSVLQGSSIQTTANVYNFTDNQIVSLRADTGSSGIECSFNQTSGNYTYTSLLTLNASQSTVTGTYPIVVTATNGPITKNSTFQLSVLNSNVTVTGRVLLSGGTALDFLNLNFIDRQTGQNIQVNRQGLSTVFNVTLSNQHSYDVKVTYFVLDLGQIPTDDLGTYSVDASAGVTSLSHDFKFGWG